MSISEQVADLEKQVRKAEDALAGMRAGLSGEPLSQHDRYSKAFKRGHEEGDMYLSGLRAGLRNSPTPETTTEAIESGREEGKRLRRDIFAVDLDDLAFQTSTVAAIMGDPMPKGGSPLGYEKGQRVRRDLLGEDRDADLRRALMRALRYADSVALLSWEEVLRGVMGASGKAAKDVDDLSKEEREKRIAKQQQTSRYPARFAEMGTAVTTEHITYMIDPSAIPEGGVPPVPAGLVFTPDSAPKPPTPRTGGNPPEPEIGMVYRGPGYAGVLTSLPWFWAADVSEVRAPWGGPVVWRCA